MADLPFNVGDRVVRYGKPHLGIGIVEHAEKDGRVYSFRVVWPLTPRRRTVKWIGFHGKSDLRREAYSIRNVSRNVGNDLIVCIREQKRGVTVVGRISG